MKMKETGSEKCGLIDPPLVIHPGAGINHPKRGWVAKDVK